MYVIKCTLLVSLDPIITAFTFDVDKRIGHIREAKEWADTAMKSLGYTMEEYSMRVVSR